MTLLTLVSLSAVVAAAVGPTPPPRREPQLTGSARITGRVSASDNGAPVRRARIALAGSPAEAQRVGGARSHVQTEVETDDNGAFEFTGVPAGSYSISIVEANGFVGLARGRRVVVHEGQALRVSIKLARTGAIVGRIADNHGEGLLGIEVVPFLKRDFRGHVIVTPVYASRGLTNDLGRFRLFNLPPGEYFVVATAIYHPRSAAPPRRSGFLATYYPGTRALEDARRVVVRSGRDAANINFSLVSGPLAQVVVDAVDSGGQPLGRQASATLNVLNDNVSVSSSTRTAIRQDDGRFVFSDVPHGDYYLVVSTSYRREEAAYVNVNIDRDVTLNVQTNRGASVSGRFVVQGDQEHGDDTRPTNVAIFASPPLGKYGPPYAERATAHPKGTDTFELTGLRGPMVLHAQMSGALLMSIARAGGKDLAGTTLDFAGTENMDDLLVVFTRERARVEATVTGLREPEDAETVLVMLFSEDPARWHSGSLSYTAIEANVAGPRTLQLGPVVPGRYLIAAVPSPGVSFPTQRAILERLRTVAVPVTLTAGEITKIVLPVSR